ncbi:13E12 repeat family protein [Gordonia mangrovi]|uniref:13E12 repeat family protein n=1 Tax=Gordonia mangrovi TaxID=2665643 RepID=UPI0021AC39C5|nr:13E12 repeat family protein [Gordonia mangrovi]UVF80199.1 13E12 repeat family protein [Gordonia mangrovi]
MSGPGWSIASWWSDASPWPDLPSLFTGGLPADEVGSRETNDLLGALVADVRGEAFLAWHRYQIAAELHSRPVGKEADDHALLLHDGFADCAARIAVSQGISQGAAEQFLYQAVALRDRLPQVAERLRDGRITAELVIKVISRTELVDGQPYAADVDAEIAANLDSHTTAWSAHRLRDMIDRIIFRHHPDAVRERRRQALDKRGVHAKNTGDGMGEISATMAAENVRIAADAVRALADAVCDNDERTRQQRASDAMFALLSGTAFECTCGLDTCTAVIPEATTVPPADAKIVIHVVCDEATLDGAEHAGFIDGYGVVDDQHVRDLAARTDAVIKPIVPKGTEPDADGGFTVDAHLPSDPYRPSSALETFIRIRDGYSVIPGNDTPAWRADIDHVAEYNFADPARGGQTVPDNLNVKDRFSHIRKTFGAWLDDQYRDRQGRLRTEFRTPEGLVIGGDSECMEKLFPGLRRIRFKSPPPPAAAKPNGADPPPPTPPTRSMPRVAAKHARRQQERERNRHRRLTEEQQDGGDG